MLVHDGDVDDGNVDDGGVDDGDGDLLDHPGASELRALEPLLKQIQFCAH